MSTIPTGNTMEVVLDRMKRAGNFAHNGSYIGETYAADAQQLAVHIRAARSMLDEAQRALDAMVA